MNIYYHKKILYLFITLIATTPLYFLQPFQDSLIYYNQAITIWENNLYFGIENVYNETKKIEPFILFLFYLEGILDLKTPHEFIFINGFFCNSILLIAGASIFKKTNIRLKYYHVILILLCYTIFSNTIYIWRSIYAISFFILSITQSKKYLKITFFILSIISHQSIILFYIIFIILISLKKTSEIKVTIYSSIIGIGLYFIINKFTFLAFFISGDLSSFLKNDKDTLVRVLINLYCLLILFFVNSKSKIHFNFKIFSMSLLILSISLFFNWQTMSRISAPALILFPILILTNETKKYGNSILLKVALSLSLIPTLRIIYLIVFQSYPN